MRTIRHVGTPTARRIAAQPGSLGEKVRLVVEPGGDIIGQVERAVVATGAPAAVFTLVGGKVDQLTLMTGGTGRGGKPVDFRGPHVLAVPADIICGTGICGQDETGIIFSHCHAVFTDSGGRTVGGHLISGKTVAGGRGITIDIQLVEGATFIRRSDIETGFSIFHPVAA